MSFYDNQATSYPGGTFTSAENFFTGSQSGHFSGTTPVDISHSTLEPTAREFFPTSSFSETNNGAVRRRPQQHNKFRDNKESGNWRNRYGSGRTFNSSRSNFSNKTGREDQYAHVPANYRSDNSYNTTDFQNDEERQPEPERNSQKYHEDHYDDHVEYNDFQSRDQGNNSVPSSSRNYRNTKRYDNYYQGRSKGNYNEKNSMNYDDKRSNNYKKQNNNFTNEDNSRRNNQTQKRNSYKSYYDSRGSQKSREGSSSNNWRKENVGVEKSSSNVIKSSTKKLDAASQRERLIEMLNRRMLECLVCCEKIKNTDKVWSCILCYHIFHLNCVVAWAKSSKIENGWRCPACQNVCSEVPKQYKCYCNKAVEPRYEPGVIPHGCGEMCLRKGRNCEHKCTILCHPGPCPDCVIMISKSCGCGATQQMVKCSTDIELTCGAICDKQLECGLHRCLEHCHQGDCPPCGKSIIQECYCAKEGRKVPCCGEYKGQNHYSCGEVCDKLLSCGNHRCQSICHEGPCEICPVDISVIKTCPCGRSPLKTQRVSCLDPVPCCDKVCDKILKCGQPNSPHRCEATCHEGACPPCPLTTVVKCRCGHMDKEIPCQELTTKADDARCQKKCTKKRLCGKHKCNQLCCIEIEHICPLPCNRLLSCGQHRCERTCHSGRCPTCVETSFEELYCECGASVIYPPVPCGTKPPNCLNPCSRPRHCGHEVNHACHTGPCPPCTVLCKRWCYGHHEQRPAIPCHQENFSCGLPCGKDMSCKRHKCVKPCHDGPCPTPCKLPCNVPRELCGHPCGRPCHVPPCPESSCKQMVPVTCPCGLQKSTRPCTEVADEFKNIQMAQLKEKMGSLSTSSTIDLTDIFNAPKKPTVLKILECTEECRVLDRNRRLAIGLQIRNPDLSQKLTPRYSDFMRQWAKKDPHFCQKIHDKLSELVQLAKNSKQKSRSYSFDSMNRDKRHFIHEYCEHFGVDSAAYDMEPNRNIVATAVKDKSWLPSMSLLEIIQRENGQRRVPGPVLGARGPTSKTETVSLKLPSRVQRSNTPPNEIVDNFRSS
ncbi:protein shuttle craft isoform X1 [Diabrotica virgifera virgifera]|uniref:Protein shuttle craft n=1 Tax=Diabrotica virgifera virgifera TaxID=50390 RepID=A0A6P7FZ34_DIAVI|nr:protein shuttle craft isoform X1 [Diabrotica virgifera virgifera]